MAALVDYKRRVSISATVSWPQLNHASAKTETVGRCILCSWTCHRVKNTLTTMLSSRIQWRSTSCATSSLGVSCPGSRGR